MKQRSDNNILDKNKNIIIESYFHGQQLERLVRHQIESYNYFVEEQIPRTIHNFNNGNKIHSEKDYFPEFKKYSLEIEISFHNFQLDRPQIHENNGAIKLLFPHVARLRNFTYSSTMYIDIQAKYYIRSGDRLQATEIVYKTFPKIQFGKLPVMLRSNICALTHHPHLSTTETGECRFDAGGYFIINGSEKTVLGQERAADNKIFVFHSPKANTKILWYAEIKCVPDNKFVSPKLINVFISSKNNGFGYPIFVKIPRIKQPIPLFVVFRALGIVSDHDICRLTFGNELELHASISDANKYMTEDAAIKYMSTYAIVPTHYQPYKNNYNNTNNYNNNSLSAEKETQHKKKIQVTKEILQTELFPHCNDFRQKPVFLGYMVFILLNVKLGNASPDDRDSYLNKRIDLVGTLLNGLLRNSFNKLGKEMEKQLVREINTGAWKSRNDHENILNESNIDRMIKSALVENGFKNPLSTGNFSVKATTSTTKQGVAQVVNRMSYAAFLSHLRRISTPIDKSGKLVEPRKLHNTSWGYICPAETPEGQSIGIVKNLSYMAHISIPSNSTPLYEKILPRVRTDFVGPVKVFINGAWVGNTPEDASPLDLYWYVKELKLTGNISIFTSVVFDYKKKEIRVCNDGGRIMRPLLRVRENRLILTRETLVEMEAGNILWEDLLTNCKLPEAVIEYIDPEEHNAIQLATTEEDLRNNKRAELAGDQFYIFTHCEIDPSTILGVLASCIPFPEHNQSPRNCYQCAQSKQAMGVYVTNFDVRMDKTAYVLAYPTRPLVDTQMMKIIQLDKIPSGTNTIVAIMSYTGYNQEDSLLFSQGAIDRGLFMATVYHTEKDEGSSSSINRTDEIRCKPDRATTKGMKIEANYDKVNQKGLIPENELVENRDILIAKVSQIKENKNDASKIIKHEDHSIMYRSTLNEETFVDQNYVDKNGNGYPFSKTRLRILRAPVIGDKFSSRHGQKGTIGNIIPEADMPFTAEGIRPDIIINPHAIPSRMTIGQLKETLMGKALLELGLFGDGTPFHSTDMDGICAELLKCGYSSYGNEILYNGTTGKMLSCSVFIGPCFYQRLKHMVKDKIHSRANGRMVTLTRQPAEGRSRDGGLRMGEMERDCMISHGAARFTKGRMYDASDKYSVHTCNCCGMIACFNDEMTKHHCRTCNNRTDFSFVQIPYALKLCMQELNAMNIAPRIIT